MGDNTEVNGIGEIIKHQVIGTIILDLEDNTRKINNLNFRIVYYFPGTPNLLIIHNKRA